MSSGWGVLGFERGTSAQFAKKWGAMATVTPWLLCPCLQCYVKIRNKGFNTNFHVCNLILLLFVLLHLMFFQFLLCFNKCIIITLYNENIRIFLLLNITTQSLKPLVSMQYIMECGKISTASSFIS